jgi:hypothetical protein
VLYGNNIRLSRNRWDAHSKDGICEATHSKSVLETAWGHLSEQTQMYLSTPVKCRSGDWQEAGLEMWGKQTHQGGQRRDVGGGTQTTWRRERRVIDVCCHVFQIQTSTNSMPPAIQAELFDNELGYHCPSSSSISLPLSHRVVDVLPLWHYLLTKLPWWHSHEPLLPETASALSLPHWFSVLVPQGACSVAIMVDEVSLGL